MSMEFIVVAVFFITITAQAFILDRGTRAIIRREASQTAHQDYARLTRQDVSGILLALAITNGLLASILAILIFR